MSMRHAMPSLAITLVLSILMSTLYLRLTLSRRFTNSCSSASEVPNRMMSSAQRRFAIICFPVCSPPSDSFLNWKTGNRFDTVPATLTLVSCFLQVNQMVRISHVHHSYPELIMRDRVKRLLEVHEVHMEWLLMFACLVHHCSYL